MPMKQDQIERAEGGQVEVQEIGLDQFDLATQRLFRNGEAAWRIDVHAAEVVYSNHTRSTTPFALERKGSVRTSDVQDGFARQVCW